MCEENGLIKSGIKLSIIERLCDNVPISELFHKEPIQLLDWYERLFLASLHEGSKKRLGIIDDAVFGDFIENIDVRARGIPSVKIQLKYYISDKHNKYEMSHLLSVDGVEYIEHKPVSERARTIA